MNFWFHDEFGFSEDKLIQKQIKIEELVKFKDSNLNIYYFTQGNSKRSYYAGKFETPTLEDLSYRLELLKNGTSKLNIKDFCYIEEPKKSPNMNEILTSSKNNHDDKIEEELEEHKGPSLIDNEQKISSPEKSSNNELVESIGLTFKNLPNSDVDSLVRDINNNEAVFQLASQFNCLEMVGPSVRPEAGITIYYLDKTQGPICSLCCPSSLFYRNYLYNNGENKYYGQRDNNQINLLSNVEKCLNNKKHRYWKMSNGYCLTDNAEEVSKLNERITLEEKLADNIMNNFKIGIHWDTEVCLHKNTEFPSPQRICQIFCSTLPFSYDKQKKDQKKIWEKFTLLLLKGTYDATLTAAAILAQLKKKRIKVFLTAVGGGVFGNPKSWIAEAIDTAIKKHQNQNLDVFLVHYCSIIPEQFKNISVKNSKIKNNQIFGIPAKKLNVDEDIKTNPKI